MNANTQAINLDDMTFLAALLQQHGGQDARHLRDIFQSGFLTLIVKANSEGKLTPENLRLVEDVFAGSSAQVTQVPPKNVLQMASPPEEHVSTPVGDVSCGGRFVERSNEEKNFMLQVVMTTTPMGFLEVSQLLTGKEVSGARKSHDETVGYLCRAIVAQGLCTTELDFKQHLAIMGKSENLIPNDNVPPILAFVRTGRMGRDAQGDYHEVVVIEPRRKLGRKSLEYYFSTLNCAAPMPPGTRLLLGRRENAAQASFPRSATA